jgi:hypothetical protein
MDALVGADRARFERHLARCQECGQEVSGLHEATARLSAAAAAPPPAALKERTLAETARTRQLPPATAGAPARDPVLSRRVRYARTRRTWASRLALGLAGLLVIMAAALWATARTGTGESLPASQRAIATVLTAPDATILSTRVRTGGTATVVMSRRDHMLVFAGAGLRALPASRRYELWLMGSDGDRPAGLLRGSGHGMSGPLVASGVKPGDRLGLTVEPAVGSPRPTSAMVLVLAL